jgi:hypothetical protein
MDELLELERAGWSSLCDGTMVVPVDGDAKALVYAGTGNRDDGPPFVGVMTSVYVRRNGDWKLALYQQTAKT